MTSPTLEITPRTNRARGAVSNAEPAIGTPGTSPAVWQAFQRTTQPDYFGWLDHIRAAAGCFRPIRLIGDLYTVRRTGPDAAVVLDQAHTDQLPDSAIFKACGNRRATVCPACARTYQQDAYQILRAFLLGGKGVPDTVAQHPAVFATFTAPSFGLVHTRAVKQHTCSNRKRCDCRPDPCHARTGKGAPGLCQHGQPAVCFTRHQPEDPQLGRPLCLDCYDHDHQAVWNLFSGKLWHRTKQAAERYLHQLARQRGIPDVLIETSPGKWRAVSPVRLAHGKTAEMQRRAVVHFHALIRLDGVDPADPAAAVPPPAGFSTLDIDDALRHAAAHVTVTTPAHPDQPAGWHITWGDPDKGLDVKHLNLSGSMDLTDLAAAGYLAKYATKSTETTGHVSTRITGSNVNDYADPDGDHNARLIDACWRLGRPTRTPTPLSQRPPRPRRATTLGPRWTCDTCGITTRARVCPQCTELAQPEVDTETGHRGNANPYIGLRRWAHMLGFGGHFLTKTRRGCPTFGVLRLTRVDYRRARDQAAIGAIRAVDHADEETTLTVGLLTFAGAGWRTTGDALLANTSAAMARARAQAAREDLAHEIGSNLNDTRTERAA